MPDIDDETLETVIKKELSGGQIENIAKKYFVEKAIKKGYSISLSEIINAEAGFKKKGLVLGF